MPRRSPYEMSLSRLEEPELQKQAAKPPEPAKWHRRQTSSPRYIYNCRLPGVLH
jgi:hypothetical protein